MSNHRQAAKRHRQSLKRRERNRDRRSAMRNAVRQVRAAVAAGDGDAPARFANAERLLRKGVSKGVLHKKTASRTISRLHKLVSSQPATS
jgi:small subunit ribosomal protein S20